jgi:hypothetical protein
MARYRTTVESTKSPEEAFDYLGNRGTLFSANTPVATYCRTIPSTLASEDAFDLLARFSSTADWDPGVVEASQLTPDPIGVGTQFRVAVSAGQGRIPLVYRVEEYDRPRRVVLHADHRAFASHDTITVDAAADGSKVTYVAELRLPALFRLFSPIAQRMFRIVGDRAVEGLRAVLSPAVPGEAR